MLFQVLRLGMISLVGWVVAGRSTSSSCLFDEQQEHLAELQEINAEQVLYIQEMSHEASGPKDNCAIYFANDKSIYLHGRTASSVANLLSSK